MRHYSHSRRREDVRCIPISVDEEHRKTTQQPERMARKTSQIPRWRRAGAQAVHLECLGLLFSPLLFFLFYFASRPCFPTSRKEISVLSLILIHVCERRLRLVAEEPKCIFSFRRRETDVGIWRTTNGDNEPPPPSPYCGKSAGALPSKSRFEVGLGQRKLGGRPRALIIRVSAAPSHDLIFS